MRSITAVVLSIGALVLTSCVSVPRDAGSSEVQQAIGGRGLPSVEWRAEPATADDARVAALLQDDLTEEEAVALAMLNSPRLQVTLAELGIARADLIAASTITNPVFEFEIRLPGEPYRPYELRLAQSLIELIQLPRRRAAGRAVFDAAQMRVSSEVLRFAGDVRASYVEVVAATQQEALSRSILDAAQTAADLALRQHSAENITDLDLENEQALYEQAKLDLGRASQRRVLAREALARRLGLRGVGTEWRVPAAFPELPATELDQRQLERLSATQRLDLSIARRELEVAQRQVPLSRLMALEEMILDVHYEREPDGAHTVGPGVEFPIPIFNSGRAARTRAEAQFLRARHALSALETEAGSLLRDALTTLTEARARVEYYREVILPRRARIVELTALEHNAMLVGVFQLLQAKQNELQARRDFIEAQREYWLARTNLDAAVQGVPFDTSLTAGSGTSRGNNAGAARGSH